MGTPRQLKTWALVEDGVKILRELQRRAEIRVEGFSKIIDLFGNAHLKVFWQLWLHDETWVYPGEMRRLTGLSYDSVYRVYNDFEAAGVVELMNGAARLFPIYRKNI